jgi:hypothetical protein
LAPLARLPHPFDLQDALIVSKIGRNFGKKRKPLPSHGAGDYSSLSYFQIISIICYEYGNTAPSLLFSQSPASLAAKKGEQGKNKFIAGFP